MKRKMGNMNCAICGVDKYVITYYINILKYKNDDEYLI